MVRVGLGFVVALMVSMGEASAQVAGGLAPVMAGGGMAWQGGFVEWAAGDETRQPVAHVGAVRVRETRRWLTMDGARESTYTAALVRAVAGVRWTDRASPRRPFVQVLGGLTRSHSRGHATGGSGWDDGATFPVIQVGVGFSTRAVGSTRLRAGVDIARTLAAGGGLWLVATIGLSAR